MVAFSAVTLEKEKEILDFFTFQKFRSCDYTAGVNFQWREYFKNEIAVENGMLLMRGCYPDEGEGYLLPFGQGDLGKALDLLDEDASERGINLNFAVVPENGIEILKQHFQERVRLVKYKRNWSDYLYSIENLQSFSGKKMHGQKNHLNRFKREHPEYRYVAVDTATLSAAEEFLNQYGQEADLSTDIETAEFSGAGELLHNVFELGQTAGFIETEQGIVALSVGEVLNDTLYIHVEKAKAWIPGAFQAIVSEFAMHAAKSDTLYCNREDDSGDEGIRKSKTDYHPTGLVNKYWVEVESRDRK